MVLRLEDLLAAIEEDEMRKEIERQLREAGIEFDGDEPRITPPEARRR